MGSKANASADPPTAVAHLDPPFDGLVESRLSELCALAEQGTAVTLWVREVDDAVDEVVRTHGFTHWRDLWQLRCDLPQERSTLETRAFTEDDIDAFVAVNNRAFSWHPEQSGETAESVRATMSEDWFDPDGFRLYAPEGELLGFCWTKVHASHEPPLGEIFVIAIDPRAHGQGLGVPMTLAGLDWLSDHGLQHGMLYVEADNDAANATYRRIGFERHHTDRAYRLGPGS